MDAFFARSIAGDRKHVRANIKCVDVRAEFAEPYRVMPLAAAWDQDRLSANPELKQNGIN